MKAKKLGRPKLPKAEFKGVLIGARFVSGEAKEIHDAVRQSKQGKSEWIRSALLGAARSGRIQATVA